jgi:hypothetical protein
MEELVRQAFLRQHGAQVEHFMPELVGLLGSGSKPVGAVGLRTAESGPLYVEHYLDLPVESALSAAAGYSIDRREIVEVGNLAGTTCRAACRLVAALPSMLLSQGRTWIVFTGTDTVRGLLAKLGVPLLEIAPAAAIRAPSGDHWGSYYHHDPRVMAGYLPSLG